MGQQFSTSAYSDERQEAAAATTTTCPSTVQECFCFQDTDTYKPNSAEVLSSFSSKQQQGTIINVHAPVSAAASNGSITFDSISQQRLTTSSRKNRTAQSSLSSCCCRQSATVEGDGGGDRNVQVSCLHSVPRSCADFLVTARCSCQRTMLTVSLSLYLMCRGLGELVFKTIVMKKVSCAMVVEFSFFVVVAFFAWVEQLKSKRVCFGISCCVSLLSNHNMFYVTAN